MLQEIYQHKKALTLSLNSLIKTVIESDRYLDKKVQTTIMKEQGKHFTLTGPMACFVEEIFLVEKHWNAAAHESNNTTS